jgi:glucose 1-dehydrogenase
MMRFKDKVCVVTGGASGIGRATADLLASEGGLVAVLDIKEGHEAKQEPGDESASRVFIRTDVSEERQVESAIAEVLRTAATPRVDVLINCAAIMTFEPVQELHTDQWARVLAVNLTAPFLLAKHCMPHMPSGSAIINVSSVHAQRTTANVSAYAASKGGLEAFTRALSIEAASHGIRVNAVAPGGVDTPMLWSNPQVQRAGGSFEIQPGAPLQIAGAVAFLASPAASFISGTVLVTDGGQLAIL